MPDENITPQEMRRQLHERSFGIKSLGTIDVAAVIARQCLQLQRHSGLSGEDTYTMMAWNMANVANVYAKALHEHVVMQPPPRIIMNDGRISMPIETAPKDRTILLLMPELFGVWSPGWWRGSWSHVKESWAIHLPVAIEGKAGMAELTYEALQPTRWTELPPCP